MGRWLMTNYRSGHIMCSKSIHSVHQTWRNRIDGRLQSFCVVITIVMCCFIYADHSCCGILQIPIALMRGRVTHVVWPPQRLGPVESKYPTGRVFSGKDGRWQFLNGLRFSVNPKLGRTITERNSSPVMCQQYLKFLRGWRTTTISTGNSRHDSERDYL